MGCAPSAAFCCAVRWFRQLDSDPERESRKYSAEAIDEIVRSPDKLSFAEAARKIGWLSGRRGQLLPVDCRAWLSDPARLQSKRRSSFNERRLSTDDRPDETEEPDEKRTKTSPRTVDANGDWVYNVADNGSNSSQEATGMARKKRPRIQTDKTTTLQQDLEIVEAVAKCGMAKNNQAAALNMLRNTIDRPWHFLRRIVNQARKQGLPDGSDSMGRYIFGCIKSESALKTGGAS
jgi:hypothetical protein